MVSTILSFLFVDGSIAISVESMRWNPLTVLRQMAFAVSLKDWVRWSGVGKRVSWSAFTLWPVQGDHVSCWLKDIILNNTTYLIIMLSFMFVFESAARETDTDIPFCQPSGRMFVDFAGTQPLDPRIFVSVALPSELTVVARSPYSSFRCIELPIIYSRSYRKDITKSCSGLIKNVNARLER